MIGAIGANVAGNILAQPILNGLNGKPKASKAQSFGFYQKTVPVTPVAAASPVNSFGYSLPTYEQSTAGESGNKTINLIPSFLQPQIGATPEPAAPPCCTAGNLPQAGDPRKDEMPQSTQVSDSMMNMMMLSGALEGALIGGAVGYAAGNWKKGALIGAAIGAVAGHFTAGITQINAPTASEKKLMLVDSLPAGFKA